MTIAYCLNGPDNDSYLNQNLYGKSISECLDFVRNRENFITPEFIIKKTKFDFSNTYDGATIVSEKFKTFCNENNLEGLEFHQLHQQKGLFLFKAINKVEFDSKRRKTKFSEYNEEYSEFNEVVGATPICLKSSKELESGFYRTDIEFGRGYAKHPIIIVGTKTYEAMKKTKFNGLYFEKVLNKYDWE